MKKPLLIAAFFLHTGFIVLNSSVITREIYNSFYELKPTGIDHFFSRVIRLLPFQWYGRVSGCETGYGFFGFNVRSTGFLITEACGEVYSPSFNSFEGEIRYECLRSNFIDYVDLFDKKAAAKTPSDSIREEYMDLLIKSNAGFVLRGSALQCDSVSSGFYVLETPTLEQIRQHAASSNSLSPLKTIRYAIRPGKDD